MNIEEKFNIIAKEYDVNRKNFIPCFDDFYGNATKMITSNIDVPKLVLDLGAGTGLLIYKKMNYFIVFMKRCLLVEFS